MKIITADERLAQRGGPKIAIVGPSGVGKTSLLRTMSKEMLSATCLVDLEAGDLAIADLELASVRPRRWEECRDIACALGGPNPAFPPTVAYSEAHYADVMKDPALAKLAAYSIIFVDSFSFASRLCFAWSELQPEAFTDRGKKDLRGVYGVLARSMLAWFHQLQHAREKTVVFIGILERNVDDFNIATWQPQIEGAKTVRELPAIIDELITMTWIDFGDHKPVRAFVCGQNQFGYPGKDRSGRLEVFEPPNLGALIEKLTRPGPRKPFVISPPEQPAQT